VHEDIGLETKPSGPETMPQQRTSKGHWLPVAWCGFYGAGVIATLILYGLFQEEIMTQPYDGDRFRFTSLLVFLNRCMNTVFALIMILVLRQPLIRKAPLKNYMVVCAASVIATTCQYESLKYVSFPVQMLGKSFKMAPVMWWGMLIARKRYGLLDWVVAAAVTGGTLLFLTTGQISAPDTHNNFWGLFLLLVFLACDGFACSMQEKLFKDYEATKYNQMLCTRIFLFIETGSTSTWVQLSSPLSVCLLTNM